jgi:hypothetical protein
MKKFKIVLSLLILVLFSFQITKVLGVTQPILEKSTMLKGDSSRFYFEIQAVGYTYKQSCVWSLSGMDPLKVNFDEMSVLVNAGEIKKVYGTVSIPSDAPTKTYTGWLSVTCEPYVEVSGGSSIKKTANVPFVVNVVEVLEKQAEQKLPTEEEQKPTIHLLPILAIIILVILVICLVYRLNKKKK